jgi:hypothetical protein
MIDHAGRSVRTRTNVIISAAGVALIVAGLGLAGSWLWVIYELAVAGRAWSLDASEWLHGGRFSSFLFFLIAPILAIYLGRIGYDCVAVGPSDQPAASDDGPEETVDDPESD